MNIYFCGIGGVGLGPLAEIARDAGHTVQGSDSHDSLTTAELKKQGFAITTDQSGAALAEAQQQSPIDWFVYTAAIPDNHPELVKARELGIKTGKRDELLNEIITQAGQKLIAVAGTHGKTTTTAMITWVLKQLSFPVSYSIGSNISFGSSGHFDPNATYFIYECDEFDRNFLHFHPYLSVITSIDYDHPDTYPTQADYAAAFTQFLQQSQQAFMWEHDTVIHVTPSPTTTQLLDDEISHDITLAGVQNRANGTLVLRACTALGLAGPQLIIDAINSFPGTTRRFEKLADNLYTDYGHHPIEIAATLEMAHELSDHVVLVYQPHQNTRQHQVRSGYTTCMQGAEAIYWLPTYQTREDPTLPILTPEQLSERLVNHDIVHYAEFNDELWHAIEQHCAAGQLVLCMGAGTIDDWVRQHLATTQPAG